MKSLVRAWVATLAFLLSGLVAVVAPPGAVADSAPRDPGDARTPATVTADALPTVQVDGVVWSQAVIGDTVYAAGSFTSARPAGVQRGTNETPRANLLAYDLTTGELKTGFAPTTNAQVLSITASPDGGRLYIGGDFTSVNGVTRSRIAAIDPTTGAVITAFAPLAGTTVRTVVATSNTVYFGGDFVKVLNGSTAFARSYVAAVSAANGRLTDWNPSPNAPVLAMTLTPDKARLVLGGRFQTIAGVSAYGMGAVDATTGAVGSWAANSVVRNAGGAAAATSLSADDDSVYGTGYVYGSGGNFEGMFRASPTGDIIAMEDCHGDTYAAASRKGVLYVAGHPHSCSTVGGRPEVSPRTWNHALAFSKARTSTVRANTQSGYANFAGQPAFSPQAFYPTMGIGQATGQGQATWSVVDAGDYLLYAGEFPTVNGKIQQGLVRFTDASRAPNAVGPASSSGLTPTLTSPSAGNVRATWTTTSDPDNATLTYRVYRDGVLVDTVRAESNFFTSSKVSFIDTGLTGGRSYTYRVTASDPFGNTVSGASSSITAATSGTNTDLGDYSAAVLGSQPDSYWRLGESSGTTANDLTGNSRNGTLQGRSATRASGAISGSANTAVSLNGAQGGTAAGSIAATSSVTNIGASTAELWFRTTSTSGGRLIGLGNQRSATSSITDRVVTMDAAGRLRLSVETQGSRVDVAGSTRYNDGAWHHVVATVGSGGANLFVDGDLVATDAGASSGRDFTGFWRVGNDASWSGASAAPFVGTIDEVATYSRALSAAEVSAHREAGLGRVANQAPTAVFTASTSGRQASFDASGSSDADGTIASYAWDFGDGSSGVGRTATHSYARPGTYSVRLTVTDDGGATATATRSSVANMPPAAAFTNTTADLVARFDGSTSTDDGEVQSYLWDFGDGSSASGSTSEHAYATAGTFPVRLTVTDAQGGTDTVVRSVTVTAPQVLPVAKDSFERSISNGLGSADFGGDWTVVGGRANFSTAGGAARLSTAPGASLRAGLGASTTTSDTQTDVAVDKVPTGGGVSLGVMARGSSADGYRVHVGVNAAGSATAYISSVVDGNATTLRSMPVPALKLSAGGVLRLRAQVEGTSPTMVRFKVWNAGVAEPTAWSVEVSDSTASLQRAGGVGIWAYLNPAVTNGPLVASWDNLETRATVG